LPPDEDEPLNVIDEFELSESVSLMSDSTLKEVPFNMTLPAGTYTKPVKATVLAALKVSPW
jgi:hypothetical protein